MEARQHGSGFVLVGSVVLCLVGCDPATPSTTVPTVPTPSAADAASGSPTFVSVRPATRPPQSRPGAHSAVVPAPLADEGVEDAAGWAPGVMLVASRAGPRLMLEQLPSRPQVHGPLRAAPAEGHIVQARAPAHAIAPRWSALQGKQVAVLTRAGDVCRARVDGFEYHVDVVPDGHEWEQWELAEESAQADASQGLAQAIWDSAYATWLTAKLRISRGGACMGEPLVARFGDAVDITVSRRVTLGADRDRALAAFADLPSYRAIAREHDAVRREDPALPARWDAGDGLPVVTAFLLGDARYVSVSVPPGGCSPWDPSLWAVFRLEPGGPVLVHESALLAPYRVQAIARDAERGLVFLVQEDYTTGLTALSGDRRLVGWSSEFHGCGC